MSTVRFVCHVQLWRSFTLIIGLVVCLQPNVSWAQWPTPKLTALHPAGGQVGTTIDITVRGSDLDGLTVLQFSHPGIVATPKRKPATEFTPAVLIPQQFAVSIDGAVPPGEYEVWGVGRFGISNAKRFQVGTRAEMVEAGAHATLEAALEMTVNSTMSGHCDPNARDFYRVTLAKGQQISILCDGPRIGSRAMLTLELFDAQGRELERVRNEQNGDPALGFTAPEAMELWVAVRDFVFRGGDEYFYRLHVHDGPLVAFAWPPVVGRETAQSIQLSGWNLYAASSDTLSSPANPTTIPGASPWQTITVDVDSQQLAHSTGQSRSAFPFVDPRLASEDVIDFRWQLEQGRTNPVRLYVSEYPLIVEDADALFDARSDARRDQRITPVTLPVEYVGRFDEARDRDAVRFAARQGDVIWIEVLSESLGCATDPELHLSRVSEDAAGQEQLTPIVVVDDSPDRNQRIGSDFDLSSDDPSYRFEVPSDGEYQVQIKDLFYGARDPRNFYRLRIASHTPEFTAIARPVFARPPNPNTLVVSSLVLRRGQLVSMEVVVDRRYGFEGSIEIKPRNLPEGVAHRPLTIPAGASTGTLVLYVDEAAPAHHGSIELMALATVGQEQVEQPVLVGAAVWGTPNRSQLLPVFRLSEQLPISVLDIESHPVAILPAWDQEHPNIRSTPSGDVFETSRGGTIEIPFRVERRSGFAEPMKLNPSGLPGEFEQQPIDLAGDANTMQVTIKATHANLKPGDYRLQFQTDAKWKYQRDPQTLALAQQEQQRLAGLIEQLTKLVESHKATLAQLQSQPDVDPASLTQAQGNVTEAEGKLTLLQQLKAEADQNLQAATNANKEVDLVETVQSWPISLRIVDSPLRMTMTDDLESIEAKPGEAIFLPVTVARDYGFAGPIDLVAALPEPLKQLSIEKVTLPENQSTGALQLTLPTDSPTGPFVITIEGQAKFNNVDVKSSCSITVHIQASSLQE